MKKAFTLAELMISLTIISIIAAILAPAAINTTPSRKQFLYKTAFRTIETVVSELSSDISLYPDGDFENTTNLGYFCNNFSDKINTIEAVACTSAHDDPLVDNPHFTTSNGMKWWGFYNNFSADVNIFVDVDGASGEGAEGTDILEIIISNTGKISPGTLGEEANYLKNIF